MKFRDLSESCHKFCASEKADGTFPVVCVPFSIVVGEEMSLLEEILYIKFMFQTSEDEEVIKGANHHSEV